jgi:hypothetical protein
MRRLAARRGHRAARDLCNSRSIVRDVRSGRAASASDHADIAMASALHAVARVRVLVGFAVISMSCARSVAPPPGQSVVDAPREADPDASLGASDAPEVARDGANVTADAAPACKPANVIHGDGHHNPGQDCMSGCHDHGFSLAGTLLLADGVTPASNATITVVDATHFSQDIVASTNGNFFSYLPVTYPVTITASMCPSVQPMAETATVGSCNSAACHGGVQGMSHL